MTELTQKPPAAEISRFAKSQTLTLVIGGLFIVGLLVVFGWKMMNENQTMVIDGPAPDFTLPLFDGGELTLSELKGQVVVVNFWASWCIPCRDEAPFLEEAWRKYRDQGVVFIGIDYLDTDKDAKAFMEEFEVSYPNGPDLGTKIAQNYHLSGVPETFFIAKDGRMGDMEIGPLTKARLVQAIETLLAEQE